MEDEYTPILDLKVDTQGLLDKLVFYGGVSNCLVRRVGIIIVGGRISRATLR